MQWADFRIRIGRFFKRNMKVIVIVLILWLCVLVINNMLKGYKPQETLNTTYNQHESVLGSKEQVPTQLKEPINELVDQYFNYCQNKEYENAYNMLSEGCKSIYFAKIDDFKKYVDTVFNSEKIYYIQNYSNYKNYYIYQIRIFDNIMKTGMTGVKDISFYEEKIVISQDKDGKLRLSIKQYINSETMNDVYEDDYLKIWIEKKDVFYEQERYTIKIKNKSQYIAVLADGQEQYESILVVGSQNRDAINSYLNLVINPGETNAYELDFTKFYDETYLSKGMIFNAVRILKTYTALESMHKYELKNAEKLYSIEIPF